MCNLCLSDKLPLLCQNKRRKDINYTTEQSGKSKHEQPFYCMPECMNLHPDMLPSKGSEDGAIKA